MEHSLKLISKWLTGSGLKVNESKTEVCLFYKKDCQPIAIKVGNATIISKNTIGVLGVIFYSRLQWVKHITKAVTKVSNALNAIKLIKK